MNEIYETEAFLRLYGSLEKVEQQWIEKIKNQLKENLYVGQPLRFSWFREKRFEGKRLYYLINETSHKTVLVAFGTKKEQKSIINYIILNKERFLKVIT